MHFHPRWDGSAGRRPGPGPAREAGGSTYALRVELVRARVREGFYDNAPAVDRLARRLSEAGEALGLRERPA